MLILSYIGPALLLVLFFLCQRALLVNHKARNLISLSVVLIVYPLGAPGQLSLFLIDLCFFIFVLIPFVRFSPNPLLLWIVGSLALVFSLLTQHFFLTLFWLCLSTILGEVVHFVFIDKGQIPVILRSQHIRTISYIVGLVIFLGFILYGINAMDWGEANFQPSPYYWVGLGSASLCVILTWLEPWKSSLWIRLAIFNLGVLISSQLLVPVLILFLWEIVFLIKRSLTRKSSTKLQVRGLKWILVVLFIVMTSLLFYRAYRNIPQRNLKPEWTKVLLEIQKIHNENAVIIGEGLPFLSQFYAGSLVQNPPIMLISSEQQILSWMAKKKISVILVDQDFLKQEWKEMIRSGVEPQDINKSILSRLLLYEGKAINTTTIKLPAIRFLTMKRIDSTDLFWIQRRKI